jgi:hypothetical protein
MEMESDSEDLIALNPSNVGHLHPDYPMDASADRFKSNMQKQVKDLKESTDQLVGAFSRFEESCDETDWQIVESARMEVQEIRTHLVKMRGEAMKGEGDVAMELANEELARVDRVVALVMDGSLSSRISVPTNEVGVSFWETVCNSPTTNSDQVGRMTLSHDSVNIDKVPNPVNSLQVEAEVNDVHLDHTVNPPPGFHVFRVRDRSLQLLPVEPE